MRERIFGRTGWRVGEIGYGMWGLAGWTDSDDEQTRQALQLAVEAGPGRSERSAGAVHRSAAKTLDPN